MQFTIKTLIMISSLIFIQINHPMAMGLILLIQTLLTCLTIGLLAKSFWFSYILFLVFLGGMLVLFIYVTSLASNEMFSLSMKMTIVNMFIMILLVSMALLTDPSLMDPLMQNNEMNELINSTSMLEENMLTLNKIYNYPTNMITIMLINYLLVTLIVIVKITNMFYGPIRQMN
uniref:NADH-ubiquinone oxidoreductase chain 6 n=1 Tax=Medetera sp. Qilemoge-2020 TaxID=2766003 RepID=A0A7H9SMR7_9MUSC|nr:NADH dehydrogenase subunit 6 [Medetera sp. Qilemoge-2020]